MENVNTRLLWITLYATKVEVLYLRAFCQLHLLINNFDKKFNSRQRLRLSRRRHSPSPADLPAFPRAPKASVRTVARFTRLSGHWHVTSPVNWTWHKSISSTVLQITTFGSYRKLTIHSTIWTICSSSFLAPITHLNDNPGWTCGKKLFWVAVRNICLTFWMKSVVYAVPYKVFIKKRTFWYVDRDASICIIKRGYLFA